MILWAMLAVIGISFVISLFATSLSKRVSHRLGMLDHPGQHKAHAQPTPLLGGSAIFGAILGPTLLGLALCRIWAARPESIPFWVPRELDVYIPGAAGRALQALGILAAAGVLHVVGLIDDKRHLGPWLKLLVQTLVAAGVVFFCDVRILTVAGPALSIIASILWLVVITNSFNLLDNMDGLAAGVGVICAAALLAAAAGMGQLFVSAWCAVLLGALLGFLPHNFPPARVFMGDAGSLVVGFLLAVVSCMTTYVRPGQADVSAILYGLLVPLLLMAIPLYDTFSVVWIRIREGRNPMIGDRRHFSHRLLRRGMSVRTVVLTIYLCTGSTAIAASLLPHTAGVVPAVMILAQAIFILLVIALLEAPKRG
ncbi:MAG TPA: undecaprenyl/decaprenyl-phosphate alpha-N-acetylglucosaminyl 1-phosphate transferase [Phycisphaerae bacterium]|nr:undecaprenyl/decaprenyl-phosphate alpha-N-acetylglucosaminyl 1-phosphate transferase [Phycisphaerae bacterium]